MRFRTLLATLLGLLAVVVVSFLSLQNRDLLVRPFGFGGGAVVPVYVAAIVVFLVGFLPPGLSLFVSTLRRDLAERQARRSSRETVSLDQVLRRAIDLVTDGQLNKAAIELERFIAERDEDFVGRLTYGAVLRQLGRAEEAVAVHQRALEHHPHSVALLYELIEDFERLGRTEVARELRNRVVRVFPDRRLRALRERRAAEIGHQDWRAATAVQDEIDALLAGGPDERAPHRSADLRRGLVYQRGVALLEAERAEDAALIFRNLLGEDAGFIPARIMLGEALLLRDDEDGAVATWLDGWRTCADPVFLQRVEDHFIEQEQPLRAIEVLRSLIASSRNDVLPRFFLGRLYYRLEMLDEAARELQRIERRAHASPTFHFLLGRIRERRGEVALALRSYLACAERLGVRERSYLCRNCQARSAEWHDRCAECGAWNSVVLSLERERLESAERLVAPVPSWGEGAEASEE